MRGLFDEIAGDRALRGYGIALAAVQCVVALHWLIGGRAAEVLAQDPLCWPFATGCLGGRGWLAAHLDAVLYGLLAGSALAGAAFARRGTVAWGCLLLVGLKLVELGVMLGDYRFRANQHYMALFALVAFVALPGRRDVLRLVVGAFYFGAGLLKLDMEWVSGAALYKPLWFFTTPGWVQAACVYVIVLELVVVWGLFARRRWVFWGALLQFGVFHVFSWPVVGAFYPLVMFGLLAVFPLCRRWPAAEPGARSLLVRFWTGRAAPAGYGAVGVFAALQCLPVLIPGDEAVTGEGRLAALHMFDARVVCQSQALVHDGWRAPRVVRLDGAWSHRIGCDPWVVLSRARAVCAQAAGVRVDLRHYAGRASDGLRVVAAVDDVCQRMPEYDAFGRNDWILLDGARWP
ncbi:MAG: hypothetical protein H6703_15980 [Myxococcales bacterium]|nr:hypothetical protein [Myxococcales bacterium]